MRPILVVVDTSVLLASLLPDEPAHAVAKEVLRREAAGVFSLPEHEGEEIHL